MRRRTFIKLLGGAATWPLAARAQQSVMPVNRIPKQQIARRGQTVSHRVSLGLAHNRPR